MNDKQIKKIMIVGGGTAGWISAALLSSRFGSEYCEIQLIESDEISTVGVGEATIPPIVGFNNLLKLDENEFIRETKATFKLGIEFIDWNKKGESYIHPFAKYGTAFTHEPFHHHWLNLHPQGKAQALKNYSLACMASEQNKFMRPINRPGSPLSAIGYAFHLDAGLYAQYLRKYAEKRGVKRTEGKIVNTYLKDDGFIESVEMENGEIYSADLFLDCSGFRGLLIEKALNTGYQDWRHYLPCDRAIAMPSESGLTLRPYTQAQAHSAGWQWRIPLQHRVGNGHVYSSQHMEDQQALDILSENLEGKALGEPRFIKFTPGRRDVFWNKNCVAIGLSSGFLEPLESTSIHLIQLSLYKLLDLFPTKDFKPEVVDNYNRIMITKFEQVRDFIVLHYKATERDDSSFWNYCRTMAIPETLQQKMDLYKSSGVIFRENDELFAENSWLAVLHGQGLRVDSHHPLVNAMPDAQAENILKQIEEKVAEAVAEMPDHKAYLQSQCGVRF
ncbi:tryptophan halogenase [Alteromonadaceae bacterium Bs31]|nr:tryptophan halogenase [Alteromonadaceae bacterium Bs31]